MSDDIDHRTAAFSTNHPGILKDAVASLTTQRPIKITWSEEGADFVKGGVVTDIVPIEGSDYFEIYIIPAVEKSMAAPKT